MPLRNRWTGETYDEEEIELLTRTSDTTVETSEFLTEAEAVESTALTIEDINLVESETPWGAAIAGLGIITVAAAEGAQWIYKYIHRETTKEKSVQLQQQEYLQLLKHLKAILRDMKSFNKEDQNYQENLKILTQNKNFQFNKQDVDAFRLSELEPLITSIKKLNLQEKFPNLSENDRLSLLDKINRINNNFEKANNNNLQSFNGDRSLQLAASNKFFDHLQYVDTTG